MYIPKHFEETRTDVLHHLIRSHPFGTLITICDGEITADHVPFLMEPSGFDFGTLKCHVSRSNPVWKDMSGNVESLVVFQGPSAYVSPSWYPSKHDHGKAVPTWNYIVVHARGVPEVKTDSDWLLNHVTQLSDTHEGNKAVPWQVSDAPAEYVNKMIDAIVGIEIPIFQLNGKWKVSQNRPRSDQLGVVAGLESEGGESAKAISKIIQETSC